MRSSYWSTSTIITFGSPGNGEDLKFQGFTARLWRRVFLGVEFLEIFQFCVLLGAWVAFRVLRMDCLLRWSSSSALGVLSFDWCGLLCGLVLLQRVLLELLFFCRFGSGSFLLGYGFCSLWSGRVMAYMLRGPANLMSSCGGELFWLHLGPWVFGLSRAKI
ncbi:hypothetical protein U1Q18_026507 [Sarracenia purpurea var. burkii]